MTNSAALARDTSSQNQRLARRRQSSFQHMLSWPSRPAATGSILWAGKRRRLKPVVRSGSKEAMVNMIFQQTRPSSLRSHEAYRYIRRDTTTILCPRLALCFSQGVEHHCLAKCQSEKRKARVVDLSSLPELRLPIDALRALKLTTRSSNKNGVRSG